MIYSYLQVITAFVDTLKLYYDQNLEICDPATTSALFKAGDSSILLLPF